MIIGIGIQYSSNNNNFIAIKMDVTLNRNGYNLERRKMYIENRKHLCNHSKT
jgi:hypothetical protein